MDLKQFLRYKTLLKSIVFLLLIGQLSSSTLTYCYWMVDGDSELIELSSLEDSESEEEEKKNEIRIDFYDTTYDKLIAICMTLHAKDYLSLHHPDVYTPPPKYFSILF